MKLRILIFCSAILLATSLVANAQPGDPGGDPDIPISGLGWLIALAIGVGIKFIRNRKE